MSKRSLMYSAALVALVAGAGIQPAQAQKGVALAPVTQWAVNKVAGNDAQGGYCAMARRFRPNTILTIARNDGNEASFALDFQTPKFKQAEAMEVLLDPGVGQQRAFEVYPVSNQAFVIRLGTDEMFFGALEKTGFLRVEFGGQSYNFNLADIDTGQAKLATCVANSVSPAAGDDFAAAPAMSRQANSSVQGEINELKRQIAMLKGDKDRLAEDIAAAPVAPVEKADTDAPGSIVIDHLSEQITELEQENQDLKTKLKVVENGGTLVTASNDKDKGVISKLTAENQKLRTALDSKQIDSIQANVLNDRIKELQDENERLRTASGPEDMSSVDQGAIERLTKENKDLQAQLEKKGGDASQGWALKQTISTLEQENKSLKNQVASAAKDSSKTDLIESRKQLEALKTENKRLQNVVEATNITGDPAVIVKELKGQVQKLSAENAAKDQKMMELAKLSTELDMLKTTNDELERQLVATATPSGRTGPIMEQKLAALETQNDALLQKIQTQTDTAQKTDAADIDALKAENEQLKKTIAESQSMAETNKSLQTQMEQLRQENEQLKAQQANAANPSEELKKAQEENQRLQDQLKQKETEAAELPRLREDVARLQKENDELKKAPAPVAAAAPTPPAGPNPEVENLTRENENLRQQIAGMGSKDSEIADLKSKLQAQEARIASAEEAQKKAEAAQKELQDNVSKTAEEQTKKLKEAQENADKAAKKLKEAQAVPAPVADTPEPSTKPPVAEIVPTPESIKPEALKAAATEPTADQKKQLKKLEKKLSKAKASGDQMAIQQTARDYMRLKNEINGVPADTPPASNDPINDLLAFKQSDVPAPVAVDTSMDAEVAAMGDHPSMPASEDLLQPSNAQPQAMEDQGVNEAQQAEQAMIQKEGNVPMPAAAAEENLSAHASQDPFADLKTEDTFKGYEATPAGEVKEKAAETSDEYSARMNGARAVTQDSVNASQAKAQQLMQENPGTVPAASIENAQSGKWAQSAPANVNTASHGNIYSPAVNMPQILGSANVASPDSVKMVSNASGADKVAYQWTADKVYGSSLQKKLSDPGRFDDEVKAYLNQTQKRCGKDFAVVPDDSTQNGDTRIDTYEIACVGQGVSSSASLLFFAKQGTFTVVAHEAPTSDLETAIDMREKIVRNLGSQ